MLFEDIEDTPFRGGKRSTINPAMLVEYDNLRKVAREKLAKTWEDCEFLKRYAVKSKRGGGGVFNTGYEYADYKLESYDARTKSAMRGTSKDYKFITGKPLKNLIVQKVVETPEAPAKTE